MFILILLISLVCVCSIQPTEAKFFSNLKSSVNKARSSISNKVRSVESKIRGTVNKVKNFESKVKKNISRAIPKPFKGTFDKVKKVVSKKTGNFKNRFNKAKQSLKKFSSRATNGFKNFKKNSGKFKNGFKKFGNKLKNSKFGRKLKEKSGKFKNGFKKLGNKLKNSKFGKKVAKKVESAKQKLRKAGAKVDKLFKDGKKKLKEKIKKVSTSLKNKVMKKLEILKKAGGKLKGTKVWKTIAKQLKKAKQVIAAIKNSKNNDQTRGVTKISSLSKFKGSDAVTSKSSITAKTISLASQFSSNAYDKSSDKNLEKQGYKVVLSKDHKKEMVASKVYYNPKDKTLVVSYRGTVSTSLKDWGNNLKFGLKPAYFNGQYAGKIHDGFLNNYMKDRDEINKVIQQYEKAGKIDKIVFTGHSKGGALGEIAATDYGLNNKNSGVKVELVTFGGPRVGDKEHAKIVNNNVKEYVRVVNTFEKKGKTKKDTVTQVPPQLFGYAHAGTEVDLGCPKSGGISCHLLDNYLVNTKTQ